MKRRRRAALALGLALALGPGCRAVGRATDRAFEGASACFAPNPVGAWGFFGGFGLGFVVGLPLCLISWPLTALTYPSNEDAFRSAAELSPAFGLGTLVGSVLAVPLVPFGLPFTPDEPEPWLEEPPPAAPAAEEGSAAAAPDEPAGSDAQAPASPPR